MSAQDWLEEAFRVVIYGFGALWLAQRIGWTPAAMFAIFAVGVLLLLALGAWWAR